jgi:hypothetical protein
MTQVVGRMPDFQVPTPEFKPQSSHQKKKKKTVKNISADMKNL